jgi:hypothetical protein
VPAGGSSAGGSLHTRVSAKGAQWLCEHGSESELGLLRLHAMAELAKQHAMAELVATAARAGGGPTAARLREEARRKAWRAGTE